MASLAGGTGRTGDSHRGGALVRKVVVDPRRASSPRRRRRLLAAATTDAARNRSHRKSHAGNGRAHPGTAHPVRGDLASHGHSSRWASSGRHRRSACLAAGVRSASASSARSSSTSSKNCSTQTQPDQRAELWLEALEHGPWRSRSGAGNAAPGIPRPAVGQTGDSITSSAMDSGSSISTIGRDRQVRAERDVVDVG